MLIFPQEKKNQREKRGFCIVTGKFSKRKTDPSAEDVS